MIQNSRLLFAAFVVALLFNYMPHLRKATVRRERYRRAVRLGYVVEHPSHGKSIISVDSEVAHAAQTMAASLAAHRKHDAISGVVHASATDATLAAKGSISRDEVKTSLALHRKANVAKHLISRPRPPLQEHRSSWADDSEVHADAELHDVGAPSDKSPLSDTEMQSEGELNPDAPPFVPQCSAGDSLLLHVVAQNSVMLEAVTRLLQDRCSPIPAPGDWSAAGRPHDAESVATLKQSVLQEAVPMVQQICNDAVSVNLEQAQVETVQEIQKVCDNLTAAVMKRLTALAERVAEVESAIIQLKTSASSHDSLLELMGKAVSKLGSVEPPAASDSPCAAPRLDAKESAANDSGEHLAQLREDFDRMAEELNALQWEFLGVLNGSQEIDLSWTAHTPEAPCTNLPRGHRVCVVGLQSASHLNGKTGRILEFHNKSGRYVVELHEKDEAIRVKLENVKSVMSHPSDTRAHCAMERRGRKQKKAARRERKTTGELSDPDERSTCRAEDSTSTTYLPAVRNDYVDGVHAARASRNREAKRVAFNLDDALACEVGNGEMEAP